MSRYDVQPIHGGERREVSLGKRTRKGLIIIRKIDPTDEPELFCSLAEKMATERMEDIEAADIRTFCTYKHPSWVSMDKGSKPWTIGVILPAMGEESAWEWFSQDLMD